MTPDKFQPGHTFVKNGIVRTVERRHGRIALLRKIKRDWSGYEVAILRQSRPPITPDGSRKPSVLAMPSNREWGTNGWSYMTLTDALIRFNALAADLKSGRMPFPTLCSPHRTARNPQGGMK